MKSTKEIWGIRDYELNIGGRRSEWTKIGTVLENRDGSLNLIFDYFPIGDIKIQIRDKKEREPRNEKTEKEIKTPF